MIVWLTDWSLFQLYNLNSSNLHLFGVIYNMVKCIFQRVERFIGKGGNAGY